MPNETYPAPPRPTLADLDPERVTTDALMAMVHAHRLGEDYRCINHSQLGQG